MPPTNKNLTTAVENYFADLQRIRASGGSTPELSYYPPLTNLLNAVGSTLKPKVFCISAMAQQGADHPDFGLYSASQIQKGKPRQGQLPESGVIEVKPATDDAWLTADGGQVSKYWGLYRIVLVTNTRDFVLLGEDAAGHPVKLETFRLADSAEDFDRLLQKPRAFARDVWGRSGRVSLPRPLPHRLPCRAEGPRLAARVLRPRRPGTCRGQRRRAISGGSPLGAGRGPRRPIRGRPRRPPSSVRRWCKRSSTASSPHGSCGPAKHRAPTGKFNWHEAVWHLRAPVLRALFQQLSDPGRLQPLGLVEVLDWTSAALDRVDRDAFFDRFNEGEAVPYFYEPFLEAFDPDLRKQLGVWYTPTEVVRYMVARVDRALKDDLGIADGLAAENVYVLDPCCGTGAFLAETLRRIAANLEARGLGALTGARVKQAATKRVFGFEIMPAPFVVAHLQVGLTMQSLDAPLADDDTERAGVFLTNALTGWEPTVQKPLPFPELEEERDRADRVKQDTPILVILGNPPYNGFAGMAVDEEREFRRPTALPGRCGNRRVRG